MPMDANVFEKILWAYFEGKATPAQKQFLLEWLKDTAHQEAFYEVLHQWEKANPQMLSDPEADWQDIQFRLNENPEPAREMLLRPSPADNRGIRKHWWIAASVVLLLTAWWQRELVFYKSYSSGYGETRSFVLADGSRVTLNADSRLVYPRFAGLYPNREAKLWGEAEFSVVHTHDDRPFLVKTPDQLEVRVLGTEFVVYSRREESKVVLTKGKVELRSLKTGHPPVAIQPGDIVTVDRQGMFKMTQEEDVIAGHLAWKEHRFVFDHTPLSDIARQVRERFGVELVIPDTALAARTLSGNYPAENADEVILILTRLLGVRSEKLDDRKVSIHW